MLPAEARSTSALPSAPPKYQTASTSLCSASTFASASRAPVTMLTTPAGTSLVSSTWYKSVAASGWRSDGISTIVLPMATVGASSATQPSSGYSSGQATPITPIGSGAASVTVRNGTPWIAPSYLSAQARSEERRVGEEGNARV